MKKEIEQYSHHGKLVWVRSDLKGQHREYCLCFSCDNFFPENREKNCSIANSLYQFDVLNDLVTPVWECKKFRFKYI